MTGETMNETERKALVDILKTFYGEAKYTGTSIITEDAPHTRRAIAAIRDLLAAADAPGLDELLDSVGASGEFFKLGSGKWCVPLWTASEITDKTIGTYGSHERNDIVGAGDTFTEALRNAVAQATGTQEGTSNE